MTRNPGHPQEHRTVARTLRPLSPAEIIEPGRAPKRPKGGRMRSGNRKVGSFVRFISGILTLTFVTLALTGGVSLYLYKQYTEAGPLTETKTIAIPKGEGRIQIARRLEGAGVISNRWSFLVSHLIKGTVDGRRAAELKAGEYNFKAGASMRHVMDRIASGRSVHYSVTIPEGFTSQQVVKRLNKMEHLSGEITDIPDEGSLLPNTYQLTKGMARADVIKRMRNEQQRVLDKEWPKRAENLPFSTKEEALILASIVEKETALSSERHRVAAVFVNRLRKRMRLQSDPTIIYGIIGGVGRLGRPILKSEIKQKTPYNTYRINGLPPTPIANPGREAIIAVLNPATTDDLYFVADGTGGHKFSSNLKEHNAAVREWRKIEKEKNKKRESLKRQNAQENKTTLAKKKIEPQPPQQPSPKTTLVSANNSALPLLQVKRTQTIDVAGTPTGEPPETQAQVSQDQPKKVAIPLPVRKPKQ